MSLFLLTLPTIELKACEKSSASKAAITSGIISGLDFNASSTISFAVTTASSSSKSKSSSTLFRDVTAADDSLGCLSPINDDDNDDNNDGSSDTSVDEDDVAFGDSSVDDNNDENIDGSDDVSVDDASVDDDDNNDTSSDDAVDDNNDENIEGSSFDEDDACFDDSSVDDNNDENIEGSSFDACFDDVFNSKSNFLSTRFIFGSCVRICSSLAVEQLLDEAIGFLL